MPLPTPLTKAAEKILNTGLQRHEVFDVIPEGATRIFDIGYGDGCLLLRLMQQKQCSECYGIEIKPSKVLEPYLEASWNQDLVKEELPDRYKEYFNWIILHDVLEHIYDPWEFLGVVNKYLAPGGKVVIVSPNAQYWEVAYSLLTGNWPLGVNGFWNEDHIRWFSFKTLCEVAIMSGFSVEEGYLQYPKRTGEHIEQYQDFMAQQQSQVMELPPVGFPAGHIEDGLPFVSPTASPTQTLKVMLDQPAHQALPYILAIKSMLICTKRGEPETMDLRPMCFKESRKTFYKKLGTEELQKRLPKEVKIQITR